MKTKVTTILFVILIIVILFVLYNVMYAKNSIVNQNYLGAGLIPIKMNTLKNFQSTSYYYEIWIYVNSVDKAEVAPTTTTTTIAGPTNLPGNIFYIDNCISLDTYNNSTLNVNVLNNPISTIVATPALHMHKWIQIIISVDNYLLDIYLNGKLVKSIELSSSNGVPFPTNDTYLNFGKADAYIAEFNRMTTRLTTDIAWKSYLSGNTGLIPMHANLTLTSDVDKVVSKFHLF